ncbi:transglutaminase family protein [Deinococcus hopiensis]|uniref:Transglutaminase-like enzyme, putative cysteine protease n=1 Tax=Deinococcus hopiensis KR-140 TaxID=695939 RepID=A0A1W1UEF1_9DEIO|nr:transglutaminase family protein [Deinococcus hopiensis]SMB79164.1 Transglutaminase-like enzyme, putative cysteine protease [Deinococcus hopiensis KR-140]
MRCEIRHITEYRYPKPAWDSFNEVRLYPASGERQTVRSFHLLVEPEAEVYTHRDYFGALVHHVHVHAPHTFLKLQAEAIVDTHAVPDPGPVPFSALREVSGVDREFLTFTARVPAGDWPEVFGVKRPAPGDDLPTFLMDLTTHLRQRFTYSPGATAVNTPLAEFATHGRGVCQDFTHAMLAITRRLGIPARYVSGYLYSGGELRGAEATHAWVECLVPGVGWVGYDPTNDCLARERHVKITHGREYTDVSPVRGTYYGGGRGELDVDVRVYAEQ